MARVYLGGPITGLSHAAATYSWRAIAAGHLKEVGVEGISPMRGKKYLSKYETLGGGVEDYAKSLMSGSKQIVTRDRYDVMVNCDAVLFNLLGAERVSIGTMVEYGWADASRKPIITVMEAFKENVHEHAFIHQLSGFMVDKLDDAILIISNLFGNNID